MDASGWSSIIDSAGKLATGVGNVISSTKSGTVIPSTVYVAPSSQTTSSKNLPLMITGVIAAVGLAVVFIFKKKKRW